MLTRQIYSEETNGAHAHYREPVPLNTIQFGFTVTAFVWSQLHLFLNSTIFSTILTNGSETGPLYMTYIQIRSWYACIRPRNTRERPCRVRKSILKTWNSDVFCNSAMELILVILKMASGYPLATFFHERCTVNGSRTTFTW